MTEISGRIWVNQFGMIVAFCGQAYRGWTNLALIVAFCGKAYPAKKMQDWNIADDEGIPSSQTVNFDWDLTVKTTNKLQRYHE
jgi:hypothetical protein